MDEVELANLWVDALISPSAVAPEQLYIPNVCDWAEDRFYIVETKRPIKLEPVQKAVLDIFFERRADGRFRWNTGLYSTIKKSGKTTVAGLVQRWAAECWGDFGEIYHMGNKRDQAKDRAFKITRYSIELSPQHERVDWDIQALKMTYLPNRSFIEAMPVNAAGSAGGNQRLTTWTEFHGYAYEEHERMFAEMQPVPTQPISFRFVESYAGYDGESLLLRDLWDMAQEQGVRLHDDYPIYGVEKAGLVAYIDTGLEARRMKWQTPEYYRKQEEMETPLEFRRIHFNEWVSSTEAFVPLPSWDALASEDTRPPKDGWVYVGVDASVSGDCTAVSMVWMDGDVVVEAETVIFEPDGDKLDYQETIVPVLEAMMRQWRVRDVAYDEYQLHHLMTEMAKRHRQVNWIPFSQQKERLLADTALKTRVRQGTLRHSGNETLRQHVQNADSKETGDSAVRIVKRKNGRPIDGLVALSMAAWQAQMIKPKRGTARKVRTNLYGGR